MFKQHLLQTFSYVCHCSTSYINQRPFFYHSVRGMRAKEIPAAVSSDYLFERNICCFCLMAIAMMNLQHIYEKAAMPHYFPHALVHDYLTIQSRHIGFH